MTDLVLSFMAWLYSLWSQIDGDSVKLFICLQWIRWVKPKKTKGKKRKGKNKAKKRKR